MKKTERYHDVRVKKQLFPVSIFVSAFVAFALLTTVQMWVIGTFVDYRSMPTSTFVTIIVIWTFVAGTFTLLTNRQIYSNYQQPIEEFSQAAHKVSQGDFSVYIAPKHTADASTHLDVLFADFNKMVEELGSIETLKTDFFTNVSHEIKTPLAIIQTNAEMLHDVELSEERRAECSDTILHATKRLSSLITNMLKLNKLENQTIKFAPEPYDLCAQLCECAIQFEDLWEKKHIEFTAELEDRTMIQADPELMDMVWTNLLSNALKFTPSGGSVMITQTSNADAITVIVSDTGCGMDEKTLAHIFDKFYQGDTSHSTEGNGLGLALVRRIIDLSDGTIEVASTLQHGTTFTVKLPLH